jgi:hypothetical protein
MTRLAEALARIESHLRARRRRFAVVGGLAVSVRTEPRLTRDVDLCVAVEGDADAEALVRDLARDGWHVLAQVEHEEKGRLATVRLARSTREETGPVVDLLFASSGIEAEIAEAAQPVEVSTGLVVPVARLGDLIAQKILARDDVQRPQDRMDLVRMLAAATDADLGEARRALGRIRERGFHRGRDLDAALRALLAECGR